LLAGDSADPVIVEVGETTVTNAPNAGLEFDYVLVGGGLQSALIVLALKSARPNARVALVERDERLGGNHTWCFHGGDLSAAAQEWITPLVARSWPHYEVRFHGTVREIPGAYSAIRSEDLHDVVASALNEPGCALFCKAEATAVEPYQVRLADGQTLRARLVVDARGMPRGEVEDCGFQKFVGHEIEFDEPHGVTDPVLMDATVDQTDGYRFFYLLPFSESRLLVEDTRFTSGDDLDPDDYREGIARYVETSGWGPGELCREEQGVLPMPWSGGIEEPRPGLVVAGYRGGWFHPGTGYSLPVAARLADAIATQTPEEIDAGALGGLRSRMQGQREYCHLLNRLLFRWYPPDMRWHVFARFYRMPQALVDRFYALKLIASDRTRLLVGRPPRGFSIRHRVASGGKS
jgi:lycopene beta-cyclase